MEWFCNQVEVFDVTARAKTKSIVTRHNVRSRQKQGKAKSEAPRPPDWDFHLYVADGMPTSVAASTNLRKLCEEYLKGRYRIRVFDVLQNPQIACQDEIIAIPTLIRKLPLPVKVAIGDLSNLERLFSKLGFIDEKNKIRMM